MLPSKRQVGILKDERVHGPVHATLPLAKKIMIRSLQKEKRQKLKKLH
jgi:hypothetical protein